MKNATSHRILAMVCVVTSLLCGCGSDPAETEAPVQTAPATVTEAIVEAVPTTEPAEIVTVPEIQISEDSPNVVIAEASAVENGMVTVTVRVKGEIQFCAFQTLLEYDESALQFIEMTKYNGVEGRDANLNGNLLVSLAWAGINNLSNDTIDQDGILMEIVFGVLNPDCGSTELTFLRDETYMDVLNDDGSYTEAEHTLVDAVVTMK